MTDKEKQIQEMAKELHCATNESFISCRKIASILVERRGYRLCGGCNCPFYSVGCGRMRLQDWKKNHPKEKN